MAGFYRPTRAAELRAGSPPGKKSRQDLFVFGVYTLLALIFTWPMASTMTSAILGDGKDGWQDTWEMWWLNRAINTGSAPYHFSTLYAPGGATNYLHSLNPILIVPVLPIEWFFNVLAAFNVAALLTIVLTAFGSYLLCRDITGDRSAAFAGGLIFGFAPHQFAQLLSHLDVAALQFFVLGVWCLYRSLSANGRASLVWALWAAACVAASGLSHPYTLVEALLVMGLLGLYWALWKRGKQAWRQPLGRTALAVFVGIAIVSPMLFLQARQNSGPDAPGQGDSSAADIENYSADLLAYAIPSPFSPLWGKSASDALRPLKGTLIEKIVFPGYVALLLGIVGAVAQRTRRTTLFWVALGLIGFLMSLGPQLLVGGNNTGLPLPASLFYALPGSAIFRAPARFSSIAFLGLAVCASLGVQALIESRTRWRRVLVMSTILLIVLEFFPAPFRTAAQAVDPWYRQIANSSTGAVLEVPFDRWDARPLESQIVSGLPLAGGYLSRQPVYPLSRGVPPFTDLGLNRVPGTPLVNVAAKTLCTPAPDTSTYLDIMRLAGVRYLALHLDRLRNNDPRIGLAQELFAAKPAYQSADLEVYDNGGGQAPASLLGAVEDSEDWGAIERNNYRWAGGNYARIYLWSGLGRSVQMSFSLASFSQTRQVEISASGKLLARKSVSPTGQTFSLAWQIPRGFTTLLISASGEPLTPASLGMGADTRPLTLSLSSCRYSAK